MTESTPASVRTGAARRTRNRRWARGCCYLLLSVGLLIAAAMGTTAAERAIANDGNGTLPWGEGTAFLPFVRNVPPDVDLATPTTFEPTGLDFPNGIAVHRRRDRLYVTSRDNDRLLKIDPGNGTVLATAETGDQPWGVVVNEETDRVYVSNFGGEVWIYDAVTLARLASVDVGSGPGLMAIDEPLDTVAVVVTGEDAIAFIEGTELAQTVDAGGSGAFAIAADKMMHHFIVTHRDGRTVRIYHRTDAGWRNDGAEMQFPDPVVPFGVAVDYRTGKFYVLTWRPGDAWTLETFQQISQGSVERGTQVPVGNSGNKNSSDVGGLGLAVNVNNQHVFIANTQDGTVSVVDGATGAILDTVAVGSDPTTVALNRDTGAVFVGLRAPDQIFRFRDE